jgi:hypothetical protein
VCARSSSWPSETKLCSASWESRALRSIVAARMKPMAPSLFRPSLPPLWPETPASALVSKPTFVSSCAWSRARPIRSLSLSTPSSTLELSWTSSSATFSRTYSRWTSTSRRTTSGGDPALESSPWQQLALYAEMTARSGNSSSLFHSTTPSLSGERSGEPYSFTSVMSSSAYLRSLLTMASTTRSGSGGSEFHSL